jgi:chromatin remodeling complex protein RSC6
MTRKLNMKPVVADQALAAIVGAGALQRTEITKRVWTYIKAHELQDATNRRRINADDALRAVFGGADSVTMFELAKDIAKHVSPA